MDEPKLFVVTATSRISICTTVPSFDGRYFCRLPLNGFSILQRLLIWLADVVHSKTGKCVKYYLTQLVVFILCAIVFTEVLYKI